MTIYDRYFVFFVKGHVPSTRGEMHMNPWVVKPGCSSVLLMLAPPGRDADFQQCTPPE